MKKPCDILKDFLYRFYAKRIPYEQRQDALVRFYSNYTSAPIFDSMMKKLSLIHNDQKPEFAESWFSQKLFMTKSIKFFPGLTIASICCSILERTLGIQ